MQLTRKYLSLLLPFLETVHPSSLPNSHPTAPEFPLAKHVVPIYPPSIPAIGKFQADVKVGSQTLRAILDTGSADTWFFSEETDCLNVTTLEPVSEQECGYQGPRYKPDNSFTEIPNTRLNVTYGSGTLVNGPMGYSEFSLGGLTIPKQQISIAKFVATGYEGNASGLLGLAYPTVAYSYIGPDPSEDVVCPTSIDANETSCNQVSYSTVFDTIFRDNLTCDSIFAFAISRSNTTGGVLTIGGIPPPHDPQINITHETARATVPIEKLPDKKDLLFYIISVDSLEYGPTTNNTTPKNNKTTTTTPSPGQFLVDTGTSANFFSADDAAAINSLFDPPATFLESSGAYLVQCNATAPQLGIRLGPGAGKVFYHNPRDLILALEDGSQQGPFPAADGGGSGICLSGVQTTTGTPLPLVLGNVFFRNVLAVFDYASAEVTFMSRVHYHDEGE